MLSNFFAVFQQVLILFLLIMMGFIFNKTGKLSKSSCKHISDIVVTFVTPCVIIKSFIRDYEPSMMKMLCLALGLSVILHLIMIAVSKMVMRYPDESKRRIMTFAAVFSNAGFIGLPLQEALLGADGVFYGAAYVVVFNIVLWSFGVVEMSGDRSMVTPRKLLVSPGIVGVVVGVILFAFSVKVPVVIGSAIDYVASLNVPLPMFVVGYYLAEADLLQALKDKSMYFCMALRLVIYPLGAILLLKLLNIDSTLAIALAVAVSSPVAATTSMFSEKFAGNTDLSVKLVAVSTLVSVLTMPCMIALAQLII